ncbi:hypothetical protein FVEN_g9338 [Fusarium venenatum]|uniref:Uncharacterized protein n=1 Tax=Fusarium venenatum TaxID=56646 RepID=A0A2L2TB65_9HYPO|nr:uncharacterized protein FVRRES_06013 [Fusarium venenatum]KAG8352610.1 hypothetical protein FVEN_g9338 [Fusarium venenatum]KAH6993038.1 hypothetical protein EDB82DRAFT_166534 [Fusarium venenatum]CEI61577.1 unnamed protein product [Fusarium venenatum]
MKFSTIFSTLLASGTALAAYVPQGNAARGLSADTAGLVNRNSGIQARAEKHANPLDSFFDELKHTVTPDDETTDKLDSRDLVGNMFGLVGSNAIDFNEKIGHGFNVTASYVGSIDLNAQATAGIEYVSKKISGSETNIPGASIMVTFLGGLSALVAKFNLNSMAQSCMSVVGQLIAAIDFNALVSGGVKLYQTVSSSLKAAMEF